MAHKKKSTKIVGSHKEHEHLKKHGKKRRGRKRGAKKA